MGRMLKILILVLAIAVAVPFMIRGKDGRPLMNLSYFQKPDVRLPDMPQMPDVAGVMTDIARKWEQASDPPEPSPPPPNPDAPIYRWRDANGTVHFSDQPNPDGTSEKIEVRGDVNVLPVSEKLAKLRSRQQEKASDEDAKGFSLPSPTSVPLQEIPRLIDAARGVRKQSETRQQERQSVLEE